LQSEVLYYDDDAVLTMQCDAQSYLKLWQGAEGKAIQASLEVGFFFGFLFLYQPNQHSEGVDDGMKMTEEWVRLVKTEM
jgi:hypothetical protein